MLMTRYWLPYFGEWIREFENMGFEFFWNINFPIGQINTSMNTQNLNFLTMIQISSTNYLVLTFSDTQWAFVTKAPSWLDITNQVDMLLCPT